MQNHVLTLTGADFMNKPLAEFVGTFALVFFGCGAAVIGGMGSGATAIDLLGISTAFGLAIVAVNDKDGVSPFRCLCNGTRDIVGW